MIPNRSTGHSTGRTNSLGTCKHARRRSALELSRRPLGSQGGPRWALGCPLGSVGRKNREKPLVFDTFCEPGTSIAWDGPGGLRTQGGPKVGLRRHYWKPRVRLGMSCAEMYSLCSVLGGPTGEPSAGGIKNDLKPMVFYRFWCGSRSLCSILGGSEPSDKKP